MPADTGPNRLAAPPRAGFEDVADVLQVSCGTLDCHGQSVRNLRLYGARGMRLQRQDTSAEGVTRPAEYDATFWSVVALEPETLTAVIADGGADPERLSLVRKARGQDHHKGGTLMSAGDALDHCLLSWLMGTTAVVDRLSCEMVSQAPRPGALAGAAPP